MMDGWMRNVQKDTLMRTKFADKLTITIPPSVRPTRFESNEKPGTENMTKNNHTIPRQQGAESNDVPMVVKIVKIPRTGQTNKKYSSNERCKRSGR